MDANTIVNGAYHSAVLSGLVMTNSMIAKKIFKVNPANLGQLSIKDGVMLTVNVYIAMMTKQALIKQGILPPDINLPQ
jgi:hypothetical protein